MAALRILRNGTEYGTVVVGPQPPDCRGIKTTELPVSLDLAYDWEFELFYCTINGSVPDMNETEWAEFSSGFPLNNTGDLLEYGPADPYGCGYNFVWLVFNFTSGNFYVTEHMFYENYMLADSWNWTVDPESYMGLSEWKVYGRVFDRGSDDLNVSVSLSRVTVLERTVPVDIYDYLSNGTLYYLFFTADEGTITVGLGSEEITPRWEYYQPASAGMPSVLGFSFAFMPQIRDNFTVTARDDGGGTGSVTLEIIETETDPYLRSISDTFGWKLRPAVPNLHPRVEITDPGEIYEQMPHVYHASVADYFNFTCPTPGSNLTYTWDFGDGTVITSDVPSANHTYAEAGMYLIELSVSDGEFTGIGFLTVNVSDIPPSSLYINTPGITEEDEPLELSAMFYETPGDKDSVLIEWDFGDGCRGYGPAVSHIWTDGGNYTVTLRITDNNGMTSTERTVITVGEKYPAIYGPFGFECAEGSSAVLNVTVDDSIADYPDLKFEWAFGDLALTGRWPVVFMPPGVHNGTLRVSDGHGHASVRNITVAVINIPPVGEVPPHIYWASRGTPAVISCYIFDWGAVFRPFEFNWTFNGGDSITSAGTFSRVRWVPRSSGLRDVRVIADDGFGRRTVCRFTLNTGIDTDGDGLYDELETEGNLMTDPSKEDTDGDYLSDYYEYHYTFTNPACNDTDGDGLADGMDGSGLGEAVYGTDPLLNDTDSDNLTDGFEVRGWNITVQYPANNSMVERWVNSDPLLPDTDGDGLSDWEEYVNGTDPRCIDTDGDGLTDWEEAHPRMIDTDGDGIPDIDEEAGFDLTVNGRRIRVYSNASLNDTDGDGLGDWEEWMPGADGYRTDPSRADTDGDGVNDTAEIYSKTEEYGKRSSIPSGREKTFTVTARFGCIIKGLQVSVGASVREGKKASFDAYVKFIPYRGNPKTFRLEGKDDAVYYSVTRDLTDELGSVRADGRWELHITVSGNGDIEALLDRFEVTGTVGLNPVRADTDGDGINDGEELEPGADGYVTNPASRDTDGDRLTDGYETARGLNPLSNDTDGDGINDRRDIDPTRDLYIKVRFDYARLYATYLAFMPKPRIQCVVWFKNSAVAATPVRDDRTAVSSWDTEEGWWIFKWTRHHVIFQYDTDYVYYFDVNDGEDQVGLTFELWDSTIGHLAAIQRVKFARTYSVKNGGTCRYTGSKGYDRLSVTVSRVGIPKINTIAVHKNGSFVRGTYEKLQHYVLIFAEVSSDAGPFRKGPNVITVPSEIFGDTKLHGMIERAVDGQGNIDPSAFTGAYAFLQNFNFMGLDRDKPSISAHIDGIISPDEGYTITGDRACLLLELVLRSSNESVSEPLYLSERVADAARIGLPADVAAAVPFDGSDLKNSAAGPIPKKWYQSVIGLLVFIGKLIAMGFVFIGNLFLLLADFIVKVGLFLIGLFREALDAIEKAVKAIVLVIVYMLLALDFVMRTALYTGFAAVLAPIALAMHADLEFGLLKPFKIAFRSENFSLYMTDEYCGYYSEWLDTEIPAVHSYVEVNGTVFRDSISVVFLDIELVSASITADLKNITEGEGSNSTSAGETSSTSGNSAPSGAGEGQNTPYLRAGKDPLDISTANLEWGGFDPGNVAEFKLFRSTEKITEENVTLENIPFIANFTAGTESYRDLLNTTGTYYYGLKIIYKDGSHAGLVSGCVNITEIPLLTWGGYEDLGDGKIKYFIFSRVCDPDYASYPHFEVKSSDRRDNEYPERMKYSSVQPRADEGWYLYELTVRYEVNGPVRYRFELNFETESDYLYENSSDTEDGYFWFTPSSFLNENEAKIITANLCIFTADIPYVLGLTAAWKAVDSPKVSFIIALAMLIYVSSFNLYTLSKASGDDDNGDIEYLYQKFDAHTFRVITWLWFIGLAIGLFALAYDTYKEIGRVIDKALKKAEEKKEYTMLLKIIVSFATVFGIGRPVYDLISGLLPGTAVAVIGTITVLTTFIKACDWTDDYLTVKQPDLRSKLAFKTAYTWLMVAWSIMIVVLLIFSVLVYLLS